MQMILNEALVLNGLLGAFLAGLFNGGVLGLAALIGMRLFAEGADGAFVQRVAFAQRLVS